MPTLHGSTVTVKHLLPNQLRPLDSNCTLGWVDPIPTLPSSVTTNDVSFSPT